MATMTRASVLLALLTSLPLHAQARPDCPIRPRTLAEMRGCYRPLLVFAPTASDHRLNAQRNVLDHAADDMMDRNVLLIPITRMGNTFKAPLDAPLTLLSAAEMAAARKRYGVSPGSFRVVLLGEDGGLKLSSNMPVQAERLSSLVDSMPTRKLEMQRPHAN